MVIPDRGETDSGECAGEGSLRARCAGLPAGRGSSEHSLGSSKIQRSEKRKSREGNASFQKQKLVSHE